MDTFTFRLVALNETSYWKGLPDGCTSAFGIYLLCVGEATHVASLQPSSYLVHIENVFAGIPTDHPFAEDFFMDDGGEPGTYVAFIDPEATSLPLSDPWTVDVDEADPDAARAAAWEQAREDAHANPPYINLPLA